MGSKPERPDHDIGKFHIMQCDDFIGMCDKVFQPDCKGSARHILCSPRHMHEPFITWLSYIQVSCVLLPLYWCSSTCMAINVFVLYNGGFLLDIIL